MSVLGRFCLCVLVALFLATPALAQDTLPAEMRASIDSAVADVLAKSGAPSASIAIVRDGQVAYVRAYGVARLESGAPATAAMRYSIGSVSKQFTAAAMLLLAEDGKLSLDDKVGRWLPDLTRAHEVTIRHLLSMTSGYQDYWPQDYVMPGMLQPVTPQQILTGWARKPLDFEPGAKWQYSNTNYVIAGLIAEKVSGVPLVEFLRARVFAPLQMRSVTDTDEAALSSGDPAGYMRYALGPLRPAPKEGKGWMFGAGELAMTASDLALWDISMIDQTILKPASYRAMQTIGVLGNGVGSAYGLGVTIGTSGGRRVISHGGEVSGFTSRNDVFPDERSAIVVLTNLDATAASQQIASRIVAALFMPADRGTQKTVEQARTIFEGLQRGRVDRSLFTSNANAYFSEQALADFAASLGPLGPPTEFEQTGQTLRGGMTARAFRIRCGPKALRLATFIMPDGKFEQYQISSAD